MLPASRKSKVEGSDEFEDMECIGLVPTLDIATGKPVRREGDEEEGRAGFDGGDVWGGGVGQDGIGVGESAVWEKV